MKDTNQLPTQGQIEASGSYEDSQAPALSGAELPCPRTEADEGQILNSSQQAVVDSLAHLHLGLTIHADSEPISLPAVVQRSGLPLDEAADILEELVLQKHLKRKPAPEGGEDGSYEPTPSGANLMATQSSLRQELIDAGAVLLPEQVMDRFEQNRGLLLNVARQALAKAGLNDVWAEDVLSEAAFYTYRRFVVREFPPIGTQHLVRVLIALVRSRAIDLIRKELQFSKTDELRFYTASYEEPQFVNALGENILNIRQERDPTNVLSDEQGVQNAYASDELLTMLARLFLELTPGQRAAVFREYFKRSGDEVPSTIKGGRSKAQLHHARKRVLDGAIKLLSGYVIGEDMSAQERLQEVGKLLLGDQDDILPNTAMLQHSEKEVRAMRQQIKSILYPDSQS